MATLAKTASLLCLLLLFMGSACKTGEATALPGNADLPWLQELVKQQLQEAPANPPAKVYRYTYKGAEVYYLTGRCCDIPSRLYNASGEVICEPDGGITGRGDGRCPDFFGKRTGETLIWEDKR